MPRPRDIVGLKTTATQRSQAIFKKTMELYSPYRVFKQTKALGFNTRGWCIIYVKPITGERELVSQDLEDKETAGSLRELFEQHWFRGYIAQG